MNTEHAAACDAGADVDRTLPDSRRASGQARRSAPRRSIRRWTIVTASFVPLLGAIGCGSDSAPDTVLPNDGALAYAVVSRVYSPDYAQITSLLWLVESIDSGAASLDRGIEVPGGASIWGVPRTSVFYVVSAEERTISKYGVRSGKPELEGQLGLAGAGVSVLYGETMIFDSPDRGFLFDLMSTQALEIDLAAMRIVRTIDLSTVRVSTAELTFLGRDFRKHGGRYVTPVHGAGPNYTRVATESKILFFDPRNGAIEVKGAPCGGLSHSTEAPNGDVYFSSDPYVAALHLVDPSSAPAPCLAHMAAGSGELDSAVVALDDVTGGPTGGLVPGPDGDAYVRVLDTSIYSPPAGSAHVGALQAYSSPAWRTWRIRLDGSKAAEPMGGPPRVGGVVVFEIEGQVYENDSTANFASTTLVRTTGTGAPARGLEIPGAPRGIVRFR